MTTTAIVLCAGNGTRMKSKLPKMLHPVCGKPLCFHVIDKALALPQVTVIAVVGSESHELQEQLTGHYGSRISFAIQPIAKGTGDAVKVGLQDVGDDVDTIVVLYGDTPLVSQVTIDTLCSLKLSNNADVVFATATVHNPYGYGRIVRDEANKVHSIVEERDASEAQRKINEVNAGVYAFDAKFLRDNIAAPSVSPEIYLTDLVNQKSKIIAYDISETEMSNVNDRAQLAQVESVMRRGLVENYMHNGVGFADPDHVYVESTIKFGIDVVVGPLVSLKGDCEIGNDVEIGQGCVVHDCIIEDGAKIKPYSILENAFVGKDTIIGPFARLRPHAYIEDDCSIGNFVEVKNSRIKAGTKANHLSYLGDAIIGEKCNIGAGVIICNYDGVNKHRTEIKDNVFVGSNVTLIAPVTIGKQSYVGAGSTINEDVPDSSLALARTRQLNKIGYAGRVGKGRHTNATGLHVKSGA